MLAGQIAIGLFETLAEPVRSVAVGELVAQQVTEADAVELFGDHVEAVGRRRRRGVVIDDEGDSAPRGLDRGDRRRRADHVLVELLVEFPPHALEDLDEAARRLGGRRHAPRQGAVDVVVRDGKGARHQATAAVDRLG